MTRWKLLQRPMFWGLLYLSLIPLFAAVYVALPLRSFHQPLLPLEPGWVEADKQRLEGYLLRAIDTDRIETELRALCSYQFTTLDVTELSAVDRRARFTLNVAMRDGHDRNKVLGLSFRVEVDPFDVFAYSLRETDGRNTQVFVVWEVPNEQEQRRRVLIGDSVRPAFWKRDLRCEGGRSDPAPAPDRAVRTSVPLMSWLFPASTDLESNVDEFGRLAPPFPGVFDAQNVGAIRLEPGVARDIQKYINAIAGDPKSASGARLRMLYLSVVTVTTLGFGDITPLTTAARFAVGMESVLGIIFIGLFLNAVASRGTTRRRLTGLGEGESGVARPEPVHDDGGQANPSERTGQ